ncbi:MAG TPA: mechanosensitive ion channel domain-containing protein [Caulobacteraceae bacterium]
MTASESIISVFDRTFAHLAALSPMALAVNVGLSVLIVGAAYIAERLAKVWLRRAAQVIPGPSDAEKHVRTRRVARFTTFVLNLVLIVAVVFGLAAVWGFDLAGWLSRGIGEQLLQSSIRMALVLILSFAAIELSGLLIHRLLGGLARDALDQRRAAQLNTLRPVLKGVAQTAIVLTGAMMLLSEAGVKIGPLLAGAGVVGIAVGFGAQTLVKDFLTGVFLIVEDIVSVGDIVRIGDCGGLVEEMTVRTIRLRDFDGTLHVFPYGEAQVIHNLTKSFSCYVFTLQVSYDSDIDRALEVMGEVGAEMLADSDHGGNILEPIEVVGVDALGDSGVVLKARIKTRPLEQWSVGREYNRRIKLAFEAAGISIPYPHLQLVMPEGQRLSA